MSRDLGRIVTKPMTGNEEFHEDGVRIGVTLLAFWRWSVSDLVSNATRGILAEFLVARTLDISTDGVRNEWDAYDLKTHSGTKIEVKSAAYLQSWHQTKLSTITFQIPRTRSWNADTNQSESEARRQADIYVFALLAHQDKQTLDPLNVNQWHFYVLPTAVLEAHARSQHSITLSTLERLAGRSYHFSELRAAVQRAENAHASKEEPPPPLR